MLTVDPTKRITIKEIKEHPCFRWGLPDDYILPSPLSVEVDELLKISPEVMRMIDKLCSLSHDQFINELKSESHNLPKVIVSMLSSHLDMEQLPWDLSVLKNQNIKKDEYFDVRKKNFEMAKISKSKPSSFSGHQIQQPQLSDASIMRTLSNVSVDGNENIVNLDSDDPFHRHLSNTQEIVEVNSCAKRPRWEFVDEIKGDVLSEFDLKVVNMKLFDLMKIIQNELETKNVQMLYPDPTHLFVRGNEGSIYTEVEIYPVDEETIDARFILRKGDSETFSTLANSLILKIKELSPKSS